MSASHPFNSMFLLAVLLIGLYQTQLGAFILSQGSPQAFDEVSVSSKRMNSIEGNIISEYRITEGIMDACPVITRLTDGSYMLAYGHAQPELAIYVKVSPDGLKWSQPSLVKYSGEGEYPDSLLQISNGSLALLYTRENLNQLYESFTLHMTFSKTGSTWSPSHLVAQPGERIATASLVQLSDNTMIVTYTLLGGGSFIVFSDDLGVTWSKPRKIEVEPEGWKYTITSSLTKTLDGRLAITFTIENKISGVVRLMVAYSSDTGLTWRNHTEISLNITPWLPNLVQGANGVFLAVFSSWLIQNELYFVRSYDGLHWTAPRKFSGDLISYRFPELEYMDNGDFLSVYWGTRLTENGSDTSIYAQILPSSIVSSPIIMDIPNKILSNLVNETLSWIAWDNNPTTYHIYRNGSFMETDTWESGKMIIYHLSELSPGSHNFEIIVQDSDGYETSTTVEITVLPSTSSSTKTSDNASGTTIGSILGIPLLLILLSILSIRCRKKSKWKNSDEGEWE